MGDLKILYDVLQLRNMGKGCAKFWFEAYMSIPYFIWTARYKEKQHENIQ